jgi:sialidase-1
MGHINILRTGLIYRNPKPHVKSIHAYFPSVVVMANGEMLATMGLGQAFESVDLHTEVARSTDGGETWQLEGRIYPGTKERLTSDCCRITALPSGEVIAFMVRADRTGHPDEGLTNEKTLGFVPTELLILRSQDFGHTWSEPKLLEPPLVGPSWELCSPIIVLKDGRWILPTSTWRSWEGECPNGIRMVAFVSHDQGRTWPEYMSVLGDGAQPVIYWESKILELPDGRLLASAWAYDEAAKVDLPNQYTLSADGGKTWLPPQSTGLFGQTLTPLLLKDGRILSVYRRIDRPGLWANVSYLEGNRWVNVDEKPLWCADVMGLTGTHPNMSKNFQVLQFGAPCLTHLPNGDIFMAFWGVEDCVSNIRWFRLRIE